MSNEDNVIDAEIVENLPAMIERETHEHTEPITKWSEEWWKREGAQTQYTRCTAHSSRTGEPCKNAAMVGQRVCRYHGGNAKHVKAAARARLDNAADRMALNLLVLALEADSDSTKLGATNSALDRVGITKPTEVVLSQGETKPWEEVYDDIAGGSRAESRARRGIADESLDNTPSYDVGIESDNSQTPSVPPAMACDTACEGTREHGERASAPLRASQAGDQGAPNAEYRAQRAERLQEAQAWATLHSAAELTRQRVAEEQQLQLESRHKRYRAHRR